MHVYQEMDVSKVKLHFRERIILLQLKIKKKDRGGCTFPRENCRALRGTRPCIMRIFHSLRAPEQLNYNVWWKNETLPMNRARNHIQGLIELIYRSLYNNRVHAYVIIYMTLTLVYISTERAIIDS